jgi:hypothetical protein
MQVRQGHAVRCDECGDVIGVYEPATVLVGERPQHTSLAADAALVGAADRRFHRGCFVTRTGGAAGGPGDPAA